MYISDRFVKVDHVVSEGTYLTDKAIPPMYYFACQ